MSADRPVISRQSSVVSCRRPKVSTTSHSLDWPLSKDEKRRCVMELYEKDVRSANSLLKSKDHSIKNMSQELSVLRHRVSLGSASTRSSLDGNESHKEVSLSPDHHDSSGSNNTSREVEKQLEEASSGEADTAPTSKNEHQHLQLEDTSKLQSIGTPSSATGNPNMSGNLQLSAQQMRLRSGLLAFYKDRNINAPPAGPAQATRLACMCAGSTETAASSDLTPDLWAALANKYSIPPVVSLVWLAKTLCPFTAVQFRKEQVPENATSALNRVASEIASGNSSAHSEIVREALQSHDVDLLASLVFRGCPDVLRADVWQALLNRQHPKSVKSTKRRQVYHKLKASATAKVAKCVADDDGARFSDEAQAFLKSAPQEIAADLKSSWNGEAFLSQARVVDSVTAIALTTAARYGRYIRGSCEMATLLLFVMLGGQTPTNDGEDETSGMQANWNDAEADAFWCLAEFIIEMQGSIVDNDRQAKQAHHIQFLLQLYDPALAESLRSAGIVALPTTRLGVALCSRAGFTLAGCARLWDAVLADPKRFEFCNYCIVAVLVICREQLLKQQHDPAALAEAVLAAPRRTEMKTLLPIAYAICAFERRCTECPYPPRPGVLDAVTASALGAAQTHLSSAWGKVRAGGAGVWRASRNVARRVAASAQTSGTGEGTIAALEAGII